MPLLERIVSGGQTGIDQLSLEVAYSLSIPTGGIAYKGYLIKNGPHNLLRDRYGVKEHDSAKYDRRTCSNVKQSDGMVLLGDVTKGGTKLTLDTCVRENKPYIVNPSAKELQTWLIDQQIKVLNVAGNRASSLYL